MPKLQSPQAGGKSANAEQTHYSYREMIRFVIDDYQGGVLKLAKDEALKKMVESLKEDADWKRLSPEIRALALANAVRHSKAGA